MLVFLNRLSVLCLSQVEVNFLTLAEALALVDGFFKILGFIGFHGNRIVEI